jgi:hypothetical protein
LNDAPVFEYHSSKRDELKAKIYEQLDELTTDELEQVAGGRLLFEGKDHYVCVNKGCSSCGITCFWTPMPQPPVLCQICGSEMVFVKGKEFPCAMCGTNRGGVFNNCPKCGYNPLTDNIHQK